MSASDQYEEIQKVLVRTHTLQELDQIIAERKAWLISSHYEGAYGTAREQALTASLAMQLRDLKNRFEDFRHEDHHDAKEN